MRFLLFLLFSCAFLQAHSLKLFNTQDEQFISIKAYFSASSPCRECIVSVQTADKNNFKLKTDKKGFVKIALNKKPIKITVDGGLGHQNSITLSQKAKQKQTFLPFWLKMLLSLLCIGLFFALLKFVKK